MPNLWPPPAVPANAAIHAALAYVEGVVVVASGMAAAGRAVDLAGLEHMAGTLCARVLDLPPAEGLGFRPALVELRCRITALEAALRAAA